MRRSHRAGHYLRQPGGHLAFIPAPLPPSPPVEKDGEVHSLLTNAERALARLDGATCVLPRYVPMYMRKEAVYSSRIEGVTSSLADLLDAEAKSRASERPKHSGEALRHIQAMNHGVAHISHLPVSIGLLRDTHARLSQNRQAGRLRRTQNWIGPPGSSLVDATFVPPPPTEVPEAFGALERFVRGEDRTPPLVRIGLAHAQFETIHPFLDRNGSVGRLLVTFLLLERKILQHPVLYLSQYLNRHQERYFELLQAVRNQGDWESWLKFFLTGVQETARDAMETARRIVELREEHRDAIARNFGRVTSNGFAVLKTLWHQPLITVNGIVQLTGVSFTAANNLMNKFVEHGILQEVTGHARNRRFRYRDYIDLFQ